MTIRPIERGFSPLFLSAAIATLLFASPVLAQSTAPARDTVVLEEMIVTGSYIPQTETAFEAGTYPIVKLDRKAIDESGYTTVSELLQKITVSNANAVPLSNAANEVVRGGSGVSLRGLGPEATLVLINGRRVAPYPVGHRGTSAFVDLKSIPLSAIERIEVLKDGASATYGADAIGGVVNIIMRRGIDGSEVFVNYGNTTEKDSGEFIASILTGASNERAKVMVGMNYYERNAIFHFDREYSKIPPFLSTNSSPVNLSVGRFAVNQALGQPDGSAVPGTTGNTFFAQSGATAGNNGLVAPANYVYSPGRSSRFNFNEFAGAYPSSKRRGGFFAAERKIFGTENIKLYADFSYQSVQSVNEQAPTPTGNFDAPGAIKLIIPARTANPILTVVDSTTRVMSRITAGTPLPAGTFAGPGTRVVNGLVEREAAAGAFNPFNPFNQDISGGTRARFSEFGNRVYRNETDALLGTIGLKVAEIADKWALDAAFSFSSIKDAARNTLVSGSRFNRIVNAADPIFTPGNPQFIGTATAYNPFGFFRNPIPANNLVTPFATVDGKNLNKSQLGLGNFVMSTPRLFDMAAGGVGFAFGAEYRQETIHQSPDLLAVTGDLLGQSPTATTVGQRKIAGYFVEARIPVSNPDENKTLMHSMTIDLAGRYEDFMTSGRNTFVPKVGLRWQPTDDTLTLRSSWSKGFREPSMYELFAGSIAIETPIFDPVTGISEPEQDTTINGNRRLAAEKSKNLNIGFVYTPKEVSGLTLSVDYWEIIREGTVTANSQDVVDRAAGVKPGGLIAGESVIRRPDRTLVQVNAVFRNLGETQVSGYDFGTSYVLPTERMGRFDISAVATWIKSYKISNVAGAPLVEVIGTDSTGAGEDGYLEWRGRAQFGWTMGNINAVLSGLYTDGFLEADPRGNGANMVESTWVFDAQINYTLFPRSDNAFLADTKVTIGAKNVFDKDPPFVSADLFNSKGYPGFLYSAENRFVYLSLSKKL